MYILVVQLLYTSMVEPSSNHVNLLWGGVAFPHDVGSHDLNLVEPHILTLYSYICIYHQKGQIMIFSTFHTNILSLFMYRCMVAINFIHGCILKRFSQATRYTEPKVWQDVLKFTAQHVNDCYTHAFLYLQVNFLIISLF